MMMGDEKSSEGPFHQLGAGAQVLHRADRHSENRTHVIPEIQQLPHLAYGAQQVRYGGYPAVCRPLRWLGGPTSGL
eukprot:scaffold243350_cov45-Prasinocladus_malaysianus.AAC.1